ncbi:SLN13 protein, partial [Centropus unirufus]|nr:SLN13 protein [Centropus unirufus]
NKQGQVVCDLETKYPEVVLYVGKICFGENARKKMHKNSKQAQKYNLARAACALLNSGGGVIRAEVENENYNLERDKIGLDLEETFRSLLLFPDWRKYVDVEQRDNHLLMFIKTFNSENTTSMSTNPRICSLSTGLYTKCGASLSHVSPGEAFSFLKAKQKEILSELSPGPPAQIRQRSTTVEGGVSVKNDPVAELFNRDQLQHGERLTFTESGNVEFKDFSTDKLLTRVKEILLQYMAGFANADGGYLWIGVDDHGIVKGFSSDEKDLKLLSSVFNAVQDKLILFHFCESGTTHNVKYEHKIFKVYDEAASHCGYVCAAKIDPFTCVAFSEDPGSWRVEGHKIRRLGACEWAAWMTDADPGPKFSETFRQELSLKDRPPLAKSVYSHKGLDTVDDLCRQLFPVQPHSIIYTPEELSEYLLQEHPGLKILIENQLNQVSEGVLVFSRSWAVEVGLPENRDITCDLLLVAKARPPILYVVCKRYISKDLFEYSRRVAQELKKKLVNTGGYIHKLCVIPKLLALPPYINCGKEWDLNIQEMYPHNYSLIKRYNLRALLHALTVALLTFKSFLSDHVGSEFLNLLTIKQYQLLSENLHKTKKLYVYGLPGTGKTVVALMMIEKIRTMLQCTQEEVLYVCENQPLRDFVRGKNICEAVTRVAFLKTNFNNVKHIIIDEAQNFQAGEGDWYKKALTLTSSPDLPEPGFFWIFLDYLQTSHRFPTGLPDTAWHDPVESLTKVVRNANSIYSYLKKKMEMIVKYPTLNIPTQRLKKLLCETTCAHAVQGSTETVENLDRQGIVKYVARHCRAYLKNGYSERDIAILCYSDEEAEVYLGRLASEMRKCKSKLQRAVGQHAVVESIRCFSGLERSIVFGIIPQYFPYQTEIFRTILVCVASRANLNLHLLF